MGKITPDQIVARKKYLSLEDDEVRAICGYLQKGNSMKTACRGIGVSEDKVYQIRKWGNRLRQYTKSYFKDVPGVWNDRERLMYISKMFDKAEDAAKVRCTEYIMEAAADDWKAAAWFLERKFPKEFGKPDSKVFVENKETSREKENKELIKEIVAIIEKGESLEDTKNPLI